MSIDRDEIIKKSTKEDSYWRGVWRRLRANKMAMISMVVLIVIILSCIFVPMFSRYQTYEVIPGAANKAPNSQNILGTDKIGRDLFVRLFYGGRISLGVAVSVTAIECVIGIILGAISGFFGGFVDTVIMRISEIFMCFPFLMICITLQTVFGKSISTLILILSVLSWPSIARIVRGQILSLREMDYMEACRALGISNRRQIFKHLFPNVLAYVIVYATMSMASVILTETSLSFLGLGVSPPTPTWGNLIQEARNLMVLQNKWWYWIPPGMMIFLSILCFNILGDGLRDAIDPKMQK
ncbi:MAG: ABC transporter permease [Solobacterium sp.]|nr:ABC transporter permease [Solobacterium sp.]